MKLRIINGNYRSVGFLKMRKQNYLLCTLFKLLH
jgi:hypothetical protein